MNDRKPIIRIVVATRDVCPLPRDSVYLPVVVGAELMNPETVPQQYARDDEGENISDKNANFCELTGVYWAWKNMTADYYGLVHYRRYLRGKKRKHRKADRAVSGEELQTLVKRYRILLPEKRNYVIETLYSHYQHTHYEEHLKKTREIIEKLCPEYLPSYDQVMQQTSGYMFNMMVMERKLFQDYCEWLFPILFELERRISTEKLSFYQARFCGRIGELIFNVWMHYQLLQGALRKDEIGELPLLYTEKVHWIRKGVSFLKAKFFHKKYKGSF